MERTSTVLTIGLALDYAQQRGMQIDVGTSDGRTFPGVSVVALDRFCIVLLEDEGPARRARVVSRDHIVSVSMSRHDLLMIGPAHGTAVPDAAPE